MGFVSYTEKVSLLETAVRQLAGSRKLEVARVEPLYPF